MTIRILTRRIHIDFDDLLLLEPEMGWRLADSVARSQITLKFLSHRITSAFLPMLKEDMLDIIHTWNSHEYHFRISGLDVPIGIIKNPRLAKSSISESSKSQESAKLALLESSEYQKIFDQIQCITDMPTMLFRCDLNQRLRSRLNETDSYRCSFVPNLFIYFSSYYLHVFSSPCRVTAFIFCNCSKCYQFHCLRIARASPQINLSAQKNSSLLRLRKPLNNSFASAGASASSERHTILFVTDRWVECHPRCMCS